MATVTDEVLRELARVARLEPPAAEARGREALAAMIAAVETLRAVDVSGVPPYLGAGWDEPPGCPLRADVPGPCLPREQILAAAPAQQDGRISTPRVRND